MSRPRKSQLRIKSSEEVIGRAATLRGYEFTLANARGEVRATNDLLDEEWTEYNKAATSLCSQLNELVGLPKKTDELWYRLLAATEPLMPESIKDHLRQDEVVLELGCEGQAVPWELLPALSGQTFLSRVLANPVRVLGSPTDGTRVRILVGHDAGEVSGWAAAEVAAVEQALGGTFEVHIRKGRELTKKQISRVLTEGSFALVHLIVYLTPAGIVLDDGLLKFADLERLSGTARPRLVVIHAVSDASAPLLDNPDRLGKAMLAGGLPAALITGWNPSPQGATRLMGAFYGQPSREKPMWQALQDARTASRDAADPFMSAQAYFAYGDWDVPLGRIKPVSIETAQNAPTARGAWRADYQLTVLEGAQRGLEIPLYAAALDNGRQITIGRAGPISVDLAIDDDGLENLTATLEKRDGKLVLSNQTQDPDKVKLNGLPVSGSVTLRGCDEMRFGAGTCMRIEPAGEGDLTSSNSMPEAGRYCLEVINGVDQDRSRQLPLESRVSLVGRLPDCSLMLHDLMVSRHHMTLVPKQEGFFLSSIGNAQVVVNGFPLKEEHHLKHKDTLQLSPDTILRFVDSQKKA